jgi:hypothetical protein
MRKLKKAFDVQSFLIDTLLPTLLILTLVPSMMLNAIHLRKEYATPNYVEVEVCKQEQPSTNKVTIVAPKEGRVGELVEVSVNAPSEAKLIWVVRGVASTNVRTLTNSVVFSSPVATNVDVFVAVAMSGSMVVEHVNLQITSDSRPVFKTLAVELSPLIGEVKTDEKIEQQVEIANAFRQVATLIKDGAVESAEDAVRITKALVKKATSTSGDAWKRVIARIEQETEAAADAGKLKTLDDHAKHWDEIANALDPNP